VKKIIGRLTSNSEAGLSILSSIVAVIGGLLIGLVILLFSDYTRAFPAFIDILTSGFQSIRNFGEVLSRATPIILTGLSVGFALKTGLFNIGASGQYSFGAFTAIYIVLTATFIPPSLRVVVAMVCAMIAGAIWAAIPGLLKAFRNVHEVISSIMTNWIGIFLVSHLIQSTIIDPTTARTRAIPTNVTIPSFGLGTLFQGSATRPSTVDIGIVIAIFMAIIAYIVLEKTKFGYELKACGFNRDAARYAGISEKRSIVFSMMISGAFAGLGGALHYLSAAGVAKSVATVLAPEGFTGISVALLGLGNPVGIIFSGTLIGFLQQSGFLVQRYGFAPEIIEIVTSVIIYFCAFVLIVKMLLKRIMKIRNTVSEENDTVDPTVDQSAEPPGDGEQETVEEFSDPTDKNASERSGD